MALIQAIASSPRIARTKFGDKTVLDCRLESGETITIWKEANNPQLMSVANGERLMLNSIEKHQGGYTYEIRETFRSRNNDQGAAKKTAQLNKVNVIPSQPMGFTVEPPTPPAETTRSIEIADYIGRLGKLYSHCYKTAAEELKETPLATPEVKDVATTLFIQTVRHFGL